jgi:hypothetical protein
MKRLIFCLVASTIVVLCLATALRGRSASQTTGQQYWQDILAGRGRELVREEGRVYFYSQWRHGWWYYWADEALVDAERTVAMQEHLGMLRAPFSTVERRLFGVLAGRPFEDDASMRAWLAEVAAGRVPALEHVAAFLVEREETCRSIAASWEEDGREADADMWGGPYTDTLQRVSYLYPEGSDERIAAWVNRTRVRSNFAVEGIYFPLLIFYIAFALPALWRVLRRLRAWAWLRYGVMAAAVNVALVAPFALGYCPRFMTNLSDQGTIVYRGFFVTTQMPALILLDLVAPLSILLADAFAYPLALLCSPVLAKWNGMYETYASCTHGGGRHMHYAVWGCMLYGVLTALIVGIAEAVQKDRALRRDDDDY